MTSPAALARVLAEAPSAVAVTGAGVSLASGIPTFRGKDPGAVWANDALEKGTRLFFQRDPVASWLWHLERFDNLHRHEPNAAHHALAALERWYELAKRPFTLITQNVDPLHERAGTRGLIKVHGSADRVRCARRGCDLAAPTGTIPRSEVDFGPFLADPRFETLPPCPACGDLVRPHVLWFDEHYVDHADFGFARAYDAVRSAGAFLFAGTSFAVGITALAVDAALQRGKPAFSVDPGQPPPRRQLQWLDAPAEAALPAALALLPAPAGPWGSA